MKKILFIGFYPPPPYGGISAHLDAVLPPLTEFYKIFTLSYAKENSVKEKNNIYSMIADSMPRSIKLIIKFIYVYIRSLFLKEMSTLNFSERLSAVGKSLSAVSLIKKQKIDAVIIYTYPYGYMLPILKKIFKLRLPSGLMVFGEPEKDPAYFIKRKPVIKNIFDLSSEIYSSSCYCSKAPLKIMNLPHQINTIYVGVDTDLFHPEIYGEKLRAELNIKDNAKVLLFLARMNKEMGLDVLLSCYQNILDLDSDVCLLICGAKGDLTEKVEMLAKENERIRFQVNVPNERKPEYYGLSYLLLAPTQDKHACMGVSIKEALASGKPVIATDSGGIPEAIESGENGYLIPVVNGQLSKQDLLDKIKLILSDSTLVEKMRHNNRKKCIDKFSNQATLDNYKMMLERLCG